jgi:NAD(P)-dependent dehydrogenase (short-subunit alcohol dehydrogenase family)
VKREIPRRVVVTGSTRGLGLGLAEAFLARGCSVMISARGAASVDAAVKDLAARHPTERIAGAACDVTKRGDVEALWTAAVDRFGGVDVWINNAGAGTVQVAFSSQSKEDIAAVVETNLLGAVHGTHVALTGMLRQGSGAIYNMEGFGADGKMMQEGMAVYGASKTATRYLSRSIAKELAGKPVTIGTLMPGVVATELLVSIYDGAPRATWDSAKRFYDIIGDRVETVAPWLVTQVLGNEKNDASIAYLTLPKMLLRFLSPSYRGRDLFAGQRLPRSVG